MKYFFMMFNVRAGGASLSDDSFPPASPSAESLIQEVATGLDSGEIPLSIYGDEEIWRLELQRVFARAWIFVAHTSEIPQAGDYVSRRIADNPLIVTRDSAGDVHVMLDSCRHRGVKLCRGDIGNTPHFRCPYHGWTYRLDGALIGVPNRAEGYGDSLDAEDWGLLKARVGVYHGLIFACLDDEAPTLENYLGDFRWYLDVHFGVGGSGLQVLGPPLRWIVPGNWKTGTENFAGDSYHTQTLHRSVALAGIRPPPVAQSEHNVHVTDCGGHATSISRTPPGDSAFWGNGKNYEQYYRESALSEDQLDLARRSLTGQGVVFPNFGWVHVSAADDPAAGEGALFTIAVMQPVSPTTVEMWRWALAPASMSSEAKEEARRISIANFGSAGIFEEDDSTVWLGTAKPAPVQWRVSGGQS